MASETVYISRDLYKWCEETFKPMMNVNFEPTKSQIVTHALNQLKANWTGEEIEIKKR